jgi:hypothetical protein
MITLDRNGKPIEYLFTVRMNKSGEIKEAMALGLAGVAIMLKVPEESFTYVTKRKVVN